MDVRLRTSVPPHTCLPACLVWGPLPETQPQQLDGAGTWPNGVDRDGMLRGSKQGVLPGPSSSETLAFSGITVSWYHFQLRSGPMWAGGEEEKGRRQREAERDREKQRQREA